jgi:hypothetical protein
VDVKAQKNGLQIKSPQGKRSFTQGDKFTIELSFPDQALVRAFSSSRSVFEVNPTALATPPYIFNVTIGDGVTVDEYDIDFSAVDTKSYKILGETKFNFSIEPKLESYKGLMVEPANLIFNYLGQSLSVTPILVKQIGAMDGQVSVFKSSQLKVTIDKSDMLKIDSDGLLVALKPGLATVTYSIGQFSRQVITETKISDKKGDFDGDWVVGMDDIRFVLPFIGSKKSFDNDARDVNGDGKINIYDVKSLIDLCTQQECGE